MPNHGKTKTLKNLNSTTQPSSIRHSKVTMVIGLPCKIRKNKTRQPGRAKAARVLPIGGVPDPLRDPDPGSPKVSCIGKVLPDQETNHERSDGCWSSLHRLLLDWFGRGDREMPVKGEEELKQGNVPSRERNVEVREAEKAAAAAAPPVNLIGMKRFASRRRPASWCGDVELAMDGVVKVSEPLDPDCDSEGNASI